MTSDEQIAGLWAVADNDGRTMDIQEMKKAKIGVLLGGRSSEREVSLKSGHAVLQSLLRRGYNAVPIEAGKDLAGLLRKEAIEIAFIVLHGRWGEDGTVQGLLEVMGIPYTGSGVMGSSVAMDKGAMKLFFAGLSIPTPEFAITRGPEEVDFPLPFVVKPANEGSTIGISIVRTREAILPALETALSHDSKVLFERFVEGPEITVGIVNGTTLPVVEVRPKSGFYDFEAKYTKGMTEYIVPAVLDPAVEARAYQVAEKIYRAFDLSGCVRIDMLVEGGQPLAIDINTSPGMTETSLVPKAWNHLGGSFDDLIEEILKGASLKI